MGGYVDSALSREHAIRTTLAVDQVSFTIDQPGTVFLRPERCGQIHNDAPDHHLFESYRGQGDSER